MPFVQPSSRRRYRDYLRRFEESRRRARTEKVAVSFHGRERSMRRSRSFLTLFREFLGLVRPYRARLAFALATLTVSTTLGLVSPAATKVVIDNVLGGRPQAGGWATALDLLARQEVLTWWWSRVVELAWQLLIPVASAALLWFGGSQVLSGRLTTGELIMFLTYLVMLLAPLES
ncbi:MAG: hypothetical protein ACKOF7_09820, partial [Phycisphaerales bacterium]